MRQLPSTIAVHGKIEGTLPPTWALTAGDSTVIGVTFNPTARVPTVEVLATKGKSKGTRALKRVAKALTSAGYTTNTV